MGVRRNLFSCKAWLSLFILPLLILSPQALTARKNISRKATPDSTGIYLQEKPVPRIKITGHFRSGGNLKATDASSSAIYTSGDISTDRSFTSATGSSSCPGTLVVTIPAGAEITSVDVSYAMTARNWGWMSEQRSQLRCVSPGGVSEAQLFQGSGTSGGTYNYSRTGLTIANGVTGGGDVIFELHAGRTWGGSGCSTNYNRVDNNTWTVTVHYIAEFIPDFSADLLSATPGQTITFTDQSTGNITSWAWDFGDGANPATAATQGPHAVIYGTPGFKTVSLTVNGDFTETKTGYIIIAEPTDWLHWDDGINFNSIGLNSAGIYQTAARFESTDIGSYGAHQITMVKVYINDLPVSATIKIWQGINSSNLTEYVSQSFTPVANSWNIVELASPYDVNINEELWFGVEWSDPGTDVFPVGIDANTNFDGKGNMLRLNVGDPNAWQPLSNYNIDGDWNVQAYLAPAQITWTGNVSTAWDNSSNWSNFTVPQGGSDVIIPPATNSPVIAGGAAVNNLSIETGGILTVGPTGSLTIHGTLINGSGQSGLIIRSDISGTGSLLCSTDMIEGSFERYITGEPEAWHLMSSPVAAQEISGDFTPTGTYGDGTGYDFYSWYEPDTSWVYLLNTTYPPTWGQTQSGNDFIPAKGYLIAYQENNPTKTFSGIFNNGAVSISLTNTTGIGDQFGANLVGNPYPSSIDWKSSNGWNRSLLEPDGGGYNIWVWNDTAFNYGVYNSASVNDEGTLGVTRYIPPTQGFFVQVSQTGTLGMTNEVRTNAGSANWLKSNPKENMLFLSLDAGENPGNDQVVIEFGHGNEFGGTPKKFSFIASAPSLYIPRNGINYSLLLLESPQKTPVIPLSAGLKNEGNYSITAHSDAQMINMLRLIDRKTGIEQDMLDTPVYSFYSHGNDEPNRFVLQLQPGVYPDPHNTLPVDVYAYGKTLYVDLRLIGEECRIEMYDLSGRMVSKHFRTGGSKHEISLSECHGVYLVRVIGDGAQSSRKIIF